MTNINKGIINSGTIGGNASVSHREKHVGDKIDIDAQSSVLNIKGRMKEVESLVEAIPGLPASQGEELQANLRELLESVKALSAQLPSESERVLASLELITAELTKDKPSKSFIQPVWQATKAALSELAQIAPSIMLLGEKLGESLSKVLG